MGLLPRRPVWLAIETITNTDTTSHHPLLGSSKQLASNGVQWERLIHSTAKRKQRPGTARMVCNFAPSKGAPSGVGPLRYVILLFYRMIFKTPTSPASLSCVITWIEHFAKIDVGCVCRFFSLENLEDKAFPTKTHRSVLFC